MWTGETEKQTFTKVYNKSPKKETLPINGIRFVFDQWWEGSPYRASMNSSKSQKSSNSLLWKIIHPKSISATETRLFQLPTYPATGEFPPTPANGQKSELNFCRNWITFPLHEAMCNYIKAQVSSYVPPKLAILSVLQQESELISNCDQKFKKTVSFDDIVHFIDNANIVIFVDFDCGKVFYPETPTKIRQVSLERNYSSRSCGKPNGFPSNDQHYCSIDEQHTSKIFLKPCSLWEVMGPAVFMSLNHNNVRETLSNQYPQPATHQHRTDS